MSPTIRVDDEVYEELKTNAEPFVDTPNTVLRRLLSLDPATEPHLDDSDAPEEATLSVAPSVRLAVTPRRSAGAKRVGVKKVARKKPAKPRTAKRTRCSSWLPPARGALRDSHVAGSRRARGLGFLKSRDRKGSAHS